MHTTWPYSEWYFHIPNNIKATYWFLIFRISLRQRMKHLNVVIYKNVNVKLDNIKVKSTVARKWEEEEGSKSEWAGFLIFSSYIKGIKILTVVDGIKNTGIFILLKKITNRKLKIMLSNTGPVEVEGWTKSFPIIACEHVCMCIYECVLCLYMQRTLISR